MFKVCVCSTVDKWGGWCLFFLMLFHPCTTVIMVHTNKPHLMLDTPHPDEKKNKLKHSIGKWDSSIAPPEFGWTDCVALKNQFYLLQICCNPTWTHMWNVHFIHLALFRPSFGIRRAKRVFADTTSTERQNDSRFNATKWAGLFVAQSLFVHRWAFQKRFVENEIGACDWVTHKTDHVWTVVLLYGEIFLW